MARLFKRDHRFSMSLADFFANSNVGLAVFDEQLRYRALNPCLAKINGISIESHLGKTLRQILGKVALRAEPAVKQVFATGQPIANVELIGKLPSKPQPERFLDNFFPIKDSNGGVREVGAVIVTLPMARIAEPGSLQNGLTPPAIMLRSWKEIANYVGTCTKTVQRWEENHQFPIRRVRASKGSVVFALQEDVDRWMMSEMHGPKVAARDQTSWARFTDSPLPTLIADDEREILDANAPIAALLAATPAELIGKNLDSFACGLDPGCNAREWSLFQRAGASIGLRNFRRLDGKVFAAEYTLRTLLPGIRILTFTALRHGPVSQRQVFYQARPGRLKL